MKKSILMIAAVAISLVLTGCGTSFFTASNNNIAHTQIQISQSNFRVVGDAFGQSHSTYVLGIGGLSRRAVRDNAVADMYRNANLSGTQVIININVKSHVSTILGIYTRITFTATGEIIEYI